MYECMYACMHARMHARMCVRTYVRMYVCVCLYVCMYVCMYASMHTRRVNLRLNPKQKLYNSYFLTDSGRIGHVKQHTKSLPESDIGKGVISNMASKMGVTILQ